MSSFVPPTPRISVSELDLGSGSALKLSGSDLVVITGPNNSGKSLLLRELFQSIRGEAHSRSLVRDVKVERMFTGPSLKDYLLSFFPKTLRSDGSFEIFNGLFASIYFSQPTTDWPLSGLADLFCYFATTAGRLAEVQPAPAFDRTTQTPTIPIERMFVDTALERRISERFKSAFGEELVVYHGAMTNIPVFVGQRPDWTKENDRISPDYLTRLEQLARLEQQGDGMKAFAGLLMRIAAFNRSILLIDEPEAFLHPPQARLMGKLIAEEHSAGTQVFVATHSRDIIQGIIEARPRNFQFARLTRTAAQTDVHWLDPGKAEQFTTNSLLRASDALNGLFHEHVVLCEGDRDAVFYREVLRALTTTGRAVDALFINTNGKDRMPEFVVALRDLGVDPVVIADIDLIRSATTLEKLVSAKGTPAPDIVQKANRIVQEVSQRNPSVSARATMAKITSAFTEVADPEKATPRTFIREVKTALDEVSPFASVKRSGYRDLPRGQAQDLYAEVDAGLRSRKIWLIPEGELEGFYRRGGRKGREWLDSVLATEIGADPSLAEARSFVAQVFALP